MRLLEITNDFPPTVGGIENYIYSLARRWVPDEITIVTRAAEGQESVDAALGSAVHRIPAPTLLPTAALRSRVMDLLAGGRFDVVHFASALPLALLGPRIRQETGVPYAVSLHGGEFIAGARLLRPLMQRALGDAAVALPVSTFTQEAVLRLLEDPPPTELVRPGVDADRFAPGAPIDRARLLGVPPEAPVILCACRLVARKGPATLIAGLPRILARHPAVVLAIVGDGPDRRRLERLAAKTSVAGSVRFVGARPWSSLPGYYAAADVFALPTRERFAGLETEGFPLVYLEAAAAGLPVVAGRAGGVNEAVVDGETGVVVDGRDVAATAEAVIALLDDRPLAGRLGSAGRLRVLRHFGWDGAVERFRTALEKHAR